MSLVEGVGDEVIHFLLVLFIVLIATIAWWSTNARPDRYRTVLLMRTRNQHPVTVNLLSRHNITNSQITLPTSAGPPTVINTRIIAMERNVNDNRLVTVREMDSIVDADLAMMENNRLHFFRRMDTNQSNQSTTDNTSEEQLVPEEGSVQASSEQIREMDSIVNAMEGEATGCSVFTRTNEANPITKEDKKDDQQNSEEVGDGVDSAVAPEPTDDETHKILIKLKYINDTFKEVDGSLDELLKDFKRRHFAAELCAERHVRLIFRGRVLGDDAATLRACGLHHRAVVHCLVHPRRARPPAAASPAASPAAASPAAAAPRAPHAGTAVPRVAVIGAARAPFDGSAEGPQERVWDMENILMTLVSVALTVVWFFRLVRENSPTRSPVCDNDGCGLTPQPCEYSNMFTASASVALFGLTVFYSVAIFGLYLSDTFHFERRPNNAVPTN